MNYMEWALQRGLELWRAREETLKKRLSLASESTIPGKMENAQHPVQKAVAQDAGMNADAENAAAAPDDTEAAARLEQRLGLGARKEDGETGEAAVFFAAPASTAPERAALLRAKDTESADNASGWMQKLLSTDGRDGASAAVTREKNDFSLAREQEVRETESFSLSLERDARRYDGGFLFY